MATPRDYPQYPLQDYIIILSDNCLQVAVGYHDVIAPRRRFKMLGAAILFFILAIIAAFFGFSGIAGLASTIAWILLAVFVVLFLLSLVVHLFRGGSHHTHL
jgi:uncharacterized membrane protein YtjA (UPF0391 family)